MQENRGWVRWRIRRDYQTYGADGLINRLPGAKGPHPNRVLAEIETAILDHCLDHPGHGALRVSHELMLKGTQAKCRPVACAGCGAATAY